MKGVSLSLCAIMIISAFTICGPSFIFAQDVTLEKIEREKAKAINRIYTKCQAYDCSTKLLPKTSFPFGHPEDAFSATWAWGDDSFNIYVWRESGYAWMEIEPLSTRAFICSSSFKIIQSGTQYNYLVLLEEGSQYDISFCGWLYVQTVFKMSQYEQVPNADLSKTFTLVFDGVDKIYSMDITTGSPPPTPPVTNCLSVGNDFSIKVPCAEYRGTQYEFTLLPYSNPNDPSVFYWKMDMSTLKAK